MTGRALGRVFLAALLAIALASCARTPGAAGTSQPPTPTAHHSSVPPYPTGGPTVTLRPGSGPVGTFVSVVGSGFDPSLARAPELPVTLNRTFPDGCALVGGIRGIHLHVTKEGRLIGQVVITSQGFCFQQPGRRHAVSPGLYQVAIGCMACNVPVIRSATFTPSARP